MDREWEIGRMAMAIDTDGTIGIRKYQKTYSVRIGLANTNIKLMEWAVDNFGGKMPKLKESNNIKWKDSYDWYLTGYKAYKVIKIIRPYLIIKGKQADLAMEMYEKVSKWRFRGSYHRMPVHKRKLAEELSQRCKMLNKTGKPIEEKPEPILKRRETIKTLEEYE